MNRLKGKVAIITGASSGMGRAAALLFSREGASVIVADIMEDQGRDVVEQIKKEGGKAEFIKVDVSNSQNVQNMIKFTIDTYGKLNILFNNAGAALRHLGDSPRITDIPEETWDKAYNINSKSVFLCCKYGIPEIIKSGGGSIVNNSSETGVNGGSTPSYLNSKTSIAYPNAYMSAKGSLIPLTKAIAIAYAADNIRCNVICPGAIETAFYKHHANQGIFTDKTMVESLENCQLVKRIGKPEDIANAALFLASDESSFITGQSLLVDGGKSVY
jgi:NAD(P)-dependent dehydrogenase (short-subunit alcohol dehydrogenase family)